MDVNLGYFLNIYIYIYIYENFKVHLKITHRTEDGVMEIISITVMLREKFVAFD
jgi:hypothetical protein